MIAPLSIKLFHLTPRYRSKKKIRLRYQKTNLKSTVRLFFPRSLLTTCSFH